MRMLERPSLLKHLPSNPVSFIGVAERTERQSKKCSGRNMRLLAEERACRYRLRVLPEFYQLADISSAFLELAAHYSIDSHQVQAGHLQRWIAELLCDLVKTSGVGRRLGKLRLYQVIRLKT